jgi:putative nucleotidyltransferase with HDIG domain
MWLNCLGIGVSPVFGVEPESFGGPGEIRTHDLFHAMEARSQLRHRPTHRKDFIHYITGMDTTRDQAWQILCEFTKSENLRKHALAVEACVAAYARKFGEDETKWSVTALLHDFDWEIHPDLPDHPLKGEPLLAERGVSEEIRRAILSHADFSGVPRETLLQKVLFACDEIAGFLTAVALVKPNRSLAEVDVSSTKRKMKDKAFARSVNRNDIVNGAAGLGVPLDEHIAFCIEAMRGAATELGLQGAA